MLQRTLRAVSIIAALAVCLAGCGQRQQVPQSPSVGIKPPQEVAREYLLDLAEQGELNSGMSLLEEKINEIAESDPALADQLRSDYQALTAASGKADIQAKAKAMADRIPPAAGTP